MVEQAGTSGPGSMGFKLQVIMNDGWEFIESKGANRDWGEKSEYQRDDNKRYWHQGIYQKYTSKQCGDNLGLNY